MKKQEFILHSLVANSYTIRTETYQGKPHIVVPVVMMKEGVHSGSRGPILHDATELSSFTAAWNGIPVMVNHPKQNGQDVSANSPKIMETAVGRIFNTTYQDGLRAEAWIDVEKITTASAQALASIRQGSPLEVSVGVYTDEDPTQGEWNGTSYGTIARNYRPDHLALLPGAVGACSWEKGCGIRNNEKGGPMNEEILKSFKSLNEKGYDISLINNEEGFQETQTLIRRKLDSMDTPLLTYFLVEVFMDDFVYRVHTREDGKRTLYRRSYTITNGEVTFGENPVQVQRNVEFVTLEERKMTRTKKANNSVETNEKGGNMSESKLPCCEAKVDALINNAATHWTASDKEWLMTQEESAINKMGLKEPVQVNEDVKKTGEEAVAAYQEVLKKDGKVETYLELMPAGVKAQFEAGIKLYTDHRKSLIKGIMDNAAEGVWEEDALNVMENVMLEKIAKTADVAVVVDYSGQGGGGSINQNTEEIQDNEMLYPNGVEMKKEESK